MRMKKIVYPGLVGEMAKHGDTQKKLGEILGITVSNVYKRLSGKKDWSISEIEILCNHYNKNYYELFTKEGE